MLNTDPPIPLPDNTNSKEVIENKISATKRSRSIQFWIIVCVLVIALAVGTGVGVKVSKDPSSPSTTSPIPTPSDSASLIPTPTHSGAPSLNLNHGALKDTSLAAVSESNGNKHIFFQDINSSLRHTIYYETSSDWSQAVEFIQLERQPRNHTPISVIQSYFPTASSMTSLFDIYYVDINDTLAAFQYQATQKLVYKSSILNQSFLVSSSARSLDAARRPPSTLRNKSDEILLFYLAPSNDLNVLYSDTFASTTSVGYTRIWQNFSGLFSAFNVVGSGPNSPFSIYSDTNTLTGSFFKPSATDDSCASEFLEFNIGNATFLGTKPCASSPYFDQ